MKPSKQTYTSRHKRLAQKESLERLVSAWLLGASSVLRTDTILSALDEFKAIPYYTVIGKDVSCQFLP
jgi:hypothetical protein